jgi:hypothetical protein
VHQIGHKLRQTDEAPLGEVVVEGEDTAQIHIVHHLEAGAVNEAETTTVGSPKIFHRYVM